jgi:hypothetical protein
MFVRLTYQVSWDRANVLGEIPVLWSPDQGPLKPLASYFVEHLESRSPSWMDKVTQAVSLLLEYLEAHVSDTTGAISFRDPRSLLKAFVSRLHRGSIGDDGSDPLQLGWRKRQAQSTGHPWLPLAVFRLASSRV